MKAIVLTILIVVLMTFAGWLTFVRNGDSASVNFNTSKVRDDTAAAVEKGKELVEDGKDLLDDGVDNVKEESDELFGSP